MPDYLHMLISIPPKCGVVQVVGDIRGKSAIHIARPSSEERKTSLSRASGSGATLYPRSAGTSR